MTRQVWAVFLGLLAGLWAVAAAPFMPPPFDFDPLLPLVILTLIGSGRRRALAMAVPAAVLLDVYAPGAFDGALLRWVLIIFMLDFIMRHLLTNRSLPVALALAFLGRVLERGLAWAFVGLTRLTGPSFVYPWSDRVPWRRLLVWDMLLVTLGFMAITFMTQRFLTLVPHDNP